MTQEPIVFETPGASVSVSKDIEDAEEVKQRKRAERFGTTFEKSAKPAALDKSLDSATQSNHQKQHKDFFQRERFETGIDLITKEEEEKRDSRASRFGTENSTLKYKPLVNGNKDDEEKKKERAARFGIQYQATDHSGQQDQDLWEARRDQGTEVERRTDTIHLYGVDLMSTKDIYAYFSEHAPVRVEWIDDSSCNVVFESEANAKRVIVSHGQPFQAGEAPELQGLDPGNIDHLPFVWHKGRDFRQGHKSIPLIYRMATVEDKKGRADTKSSRYLWLKDKKHSPKVQQVKRKSIADEDGDIIMDDDVGGKGSSRKKKKRRKRNPNGKEVEMQDAEADLGSGTVNGNQDEAGASLQTDDIIGDAVPAGKDLRELLKERRAQSSQKQDPKEKQRNKRLFSSAAAGILPSFLQSKIGGKSDNAEVKTDENLHGDQDQQKPVENQDQGPMPMEE